MGAALPGRRRGGLAAGPLVASASITPANTRTHCRADRGIKHIRTRPYTPKTNGKAERFIQTALREWAYAQAYETSDQRADALPQWLHRYNWHRPHASLNARPPISLLGLIRDNVL